MAQKYYVLPEVANISYWNREIIRVKIYFVKFFFKLSETSRNRKAKERKQDLT